MRRNNRGTVLVMVLVCLVVVVALIGGLLKGTLQARRQLHMERDCRQADLLLQAGRELAAARLAKDSSYQGETWRLAPDEMAAANPGEVTIEIVRDGDQPPQIHVVAEYPAGSELSVRRSTTFTVHPQE